MDEPGQSVNRAMAPDSDMPGAADTASASLLVESTVPLPELTQAEGSPDCRFLVLPAGEGFHGEFTGSINGKLGTKKPG